MKNLKRVSSVLLNVSADKLWTVLTDPEWTEKYMYNCKVISNFEVGSTIEWKGVFQGQETYLTGDVLEVVPQKLLKYTTIDPTFGDPSIPENYVHITYEIREQNGKILLTIVNEIFDGNEERMGHIVQGLEGMVLPSIERLLS